MQNDNAQVTPPANQGPAPGSAEYNAAMLAKAEGTAVVMDGQPVAAAPATAPAATPPAAAPAAAEPTKPQRPAHIPEKFWNAEKGEVNVEAMARSYAELERSRSQPQQQQQATPPPADKGADQPPTITEPKPGEQKPADQQQTPPVDPAAAMTAARTAASEELSRDGKLSDKSYETFNKLGFDRASVDAYITGQRAQATNYLNSMYDTAGGKDSYQQMIQWARTTFSESEVGAFDAAVRSMDSGQMHMAVNGLKARYSAEFGKGASRQVTPAPSESSNNTNAFKSGGELRAAMADPRYTRGDAAFHAEVHSRIAAAEAANIDLGLTVVQSGRML